MTIPYHIHHDVMVLFGIKNPVTINLTIRYWDSRIIRQQGLNYIRIIQLGGLGSDTLQNPLWRSLLSHSIREG